MTVTPGSLAPCSMSATLSSWCEVAVEERDDGVVDVQSPRPGNRLWSAPEQCVMNYFGLDASAYELTLDWPGIV